MYGVPNVFIYLKEGFVDTVISGCNNKDPKDN